MSDALLTVEGLTKTYGDKVLFEDISFGIVAGQKSALIARNGSGKGTLLDIITTAAGLPGRGTLQDSGKVTLRGDLRLAYLPQGGALDASAKTVREFVYDVQRPETEDEWTFHQRIEEIVSRMKVEGLLERPLESLSGGEQKKVALCHLLMDNSNLLILDEPTNHLDIEMIEWLEEFLSRQRLAILMVTHDRYFLDRVCDNIYELDHGQLYHYKGGYDYYLEKKAERESTQRAEVEKARNLYRTELEWMRRMPQARGTKSRARIDAFYDLEKKAHTRFETERPQLTVKTERLGGKVLELYNICYKELIDDYSYVFKRGEKAGIVGPNGIGKSTFLNIITERLRPTSGHVVVGQTIRFGYYTQNGMQAAPDRRVIDLVKDIAEEIEIEGGKRLSAHQFLSHFGFDDTTQYNYFGNLSGGERRRLYLLQVLMGNPNFLILDEPTNDLDIYTIQILEQFLMSYHGCLIIVSHDRSFMDHIVDHLLVFEGGGKIRDYHSTYSEYRQQRTYEERQRHKEEKKSRNLADAPAPAAPTTQRRASYKEKKEYEALTAEIEALSAERQQIESLLANGTLVEGAEISRVTTRYGELKTLLDEKELRWLELDEIM